ncbi:MAG: Fis family transcriptional regulator [Coleofasciculaceae cyanobacterium]
MTDKIDAQENSRQEVAVEMDSLERDRFELLSAYIDGEVTATERSQVQRMLAEDPQMQHLYSKLMKLRQEIQRLPVPVAETTAEETARQVFARINQRRSQRTFAWGGLAFAALFVSALSGIISGGQLLKPQLAQSPEQQEVASERLMIAVNRPLLEIPKVAVTSSEQLGMPDYTKQ